jgi:serine/threonine-protein kinase
MTAVFILAVIFGSITAWKMMSHRHKEKMAQIQASGGAGQPRAALDASVEERLGHLETIVCNVDFELNAKLNQLAVAATEQLQALPAAGEAGGPVRTGQTVSGLGKLKSGETLAQRFVIEKELGTGGMGVVYLARDEKLGEPVALKVIHSLALLDPAAGERMRREASAARKVSHVNVVRIFDIGDEDGRMFLSMEYVSGANLETRIERHGVLPPAEVTRIIEQMLDGLTAAHEQGVIHRDLKPGNVLIDDAGRVKIIDFGIARMSYVRGMTSTGMILGTPHYMAPEQISGGSVDGRTDLYAVGALAYQALTGDPPFVANNPIAVTLAHLSEPVRPASEKRAGLPVEWDAFLAKALAKDPHDRFSSAAEMKAALPA